MYEIDLLDEVLSIDLCHGVAKISEVKVGGQINILDLLGSRLCLCKLHSESFLSGRPGFEFGMLQTLNASLLRIYDNHYRS